MLRRLTPGRRAAFGIVALSALPLLAPSIITPKPQEPVPASPHAEGRVLVKLRPAPLLARLHEEPVRAALAARLGGDSVRPLFPPDGGPALRRALGRGPLAGGLGTESASVRNARRRRYGLDRWVVMELAADERVGGAVARLSGDSSVEVVVPDFGGRGAGVLAAASHEGAADGYGTARFLPNDPRFAQQWYLDQPGDADIDMPEAWDLRRSTPIPVAVLDTGVDFTHPDLSGIFEPGWDYVNDDADPSDDQGHGTHVTGLIGAVGGNGVGIAGAAYDVRIVPLKVLDQDNFGFYSWWAAGLVFAADLGVPVVNLSAGGPNPSPALLDAVRYAHDRGSVICVAMMNENSDVPYYPAAYSETIAVGATDVNDARADPFFWGGGSSWGPHIDLVAPGDGLISTRNTGGYVSGGGTSQATPLVTAVVALMMGPRGGIDPEEVRRILRDTADDQVGRPGEDTPGFDVYHGAGRLNAAAAIAEALAGAPTPGERLQALPPRPNPSRGFVRIGFNLPTSGPVTVKIYDTRGRLVRTLAEGGSFPAGGSFIKWNGSDGSGRPVPSGIYLYEIRAGSARATGKLMRIK